MALIAVEEILIEEDDIGEDELFFTRLKGCQNLKRFKLDGEHPTFSVEGGLLYSKDRTVLEWYPPNITSPYFRIPKMITMVRALSAHHLRTLIIPNSVKKINLYECEQLEFVTIGTGLKIHNEPPFFAQDCPNIRSFMVNKRHPDYASNEGVIYSKDFSRIIRYPGFKSSRRTYETPRGVIGIGSYAFSNSKFNKIVYSDEILRVQDFDFFTSEIEYDYAKIVDYHPINYNKYIETLSFGAHVSGLNQWFLKYCLMKRFEVSPNNKDYYSIDGILIDKSQKMLMRFSLGSLDGVYIIEDNIEVVGMFALFESSFDRLCLPYSTLAIHEQAFTHTKGNELFIPSSVIFIHQLAFLDTKIKTIRFDLIEVEAKQRFKLALDFMPKTTIIDFDNQHTNQN